MLFYCVCPPPLPLPSAHTHTTITMLPRYGSSQKVNVSDGSTWDWLSQDILLYTSHDLGVWKKRATVFTAADVTGSIRQRLSAGHNGPLR